MADFTGFSQEDFDVFKVNGLEPRMNELKEKVRPKLETLGETFSPRLSALVGNEMYSHVAQHARRTINPPDDTWVAWAPDKRGYKKHPHFQTGLWETHLFAWFALIYESPNKPMLGRNLKKKLNEIRMSIPDEYVWSTNHMEPEVILHKDLNKKDFQEIIGRLKNVKKMEILCGIRIDRNDPILQNGDQLIEKIGQTFETVLPLYRLSF